MNEQAIQDSYNLFVQQGYKKSIDDFKQLISTNPDALNDSFSLFQKEGYNKSIEDYKNLMGVGAQPTLKKKEPTTTASSSADISSDLSSEQNLNPFAKNTVGIPQPAPTKTVAAQGVTKPMAVATTAPTIDLTEKVKIPAIDVETQKLINDENNISTIAEDDGWYSDNLKMVSFLADKIQYLNPTAAATFPVTTKGVAKFLDNSLRAIDQGQKQGSIVAPATTMEALGKNTSSETIQKYIRATKDVERFGPSKDMQAFSKTYQDEGESTFGVIKGLVENPQVLPELVISSMSTMANLPTVAAGASVVGGAALAGGIPTAGVGAIPAALASMPYAMGTMSAVLENGLTFGELLQEELTKRNLPFTEEGVRKVLEDEKALSSMRIKAVSRGAIIGVIDGLTARVAGKVGAKLLGNTAASKIKAGAAAVGIEMVGGSGGEATARAAIGQKMDKAEIVLEGISEGPMAIPSLYTEVLKRPTFKINGEAVTEQTVKDIIENGSGAELATIKFEIKNDNVGYNKIIQDKVVTNSIKEDVRAANPDLNETSLNAITELEKQLQDIEGNKTQTGKDKAAALRQQIKNIQENQLQEEVKTEVVKDETTKPKEDAIQKPSTDESLLRGEQPEVGLQEVGKGNAQPEGPTAGTAEVVNAQPKKKVDNRPIAERQAEAESKIKLTDVFKGVGKFSKLGGSDKAAVPVSHSENNGIEIVEYAHPKTGSIDLVVTAKSDNDFVSFYRIYENGKVTNKWSSKLENKSRNKGDFKTMISSVQSLLPEGHEYTETKSISTDGLRVWNQQLSKGYELQYDENGNLITKKVAINGGAIVNDLGIEVNKENFDDIEVKSEEEFQKVKEKLLPYLNKIGLNEENIYFTEGTVKIDLPVLKKQSQGPTAGTTVERTLTNEEQKRKVDLEEALNATNENDFTVVVGEDVLSIFDAQKELDALTQTPIEVSPKTPEQEVAQLKGLFGKKEATTDSGISVSDKATVNNIKTKLADKAKTKIIESAQRGLTTLRSVLPNFDIIIHDNEGSYNAAMKTLDGTQSSKGNFAYNQKPDGTYSGRIDINLDRADGRTVAHEIFHGVMLQAFGENPKLFKAFKDRISKVLKDSTNKQLVDFANLYEGDVTYEEYLAELGGILEQQEDNISPSTLQKIAAIINEFVSKITNGTLKPFEDIKNTKDIVDFFNTISESIRKGEEINTALFQAMQEGASISIGEPSTISRSQKGEKVKFSKTPPALSFVTEADKIDINKLIDDIIAKNQKVWFWMADQLGRGNYYDAVIKGDHYLDAGPSFALDPINRDKGVLWASGLSEKTLSDQIAKADYIFFISGSAEKAKLFNKRVLDLVAERINKKSNFKKFKAAMNGFKKETIELNTIKNALSNVNSFEELANSTKRKEFLISINQIGNLKTTPEGSLKELLNSFNAFVDYNELRDGFYRDNNFTQNDIMLIGKPSKVGGKAPHSTYENAILGEVVGVPDTKIDSWNIMPQDVKDAYTKGNKFIDSKTGKEKVRGELSVAQKAKVIAAETGVVRELKSKSQVDNRKKAIAIANTMGMNDKGFFKKDSNPSQLNNQLRQYGYSVKQARETADGFGGGYYLVDEEGKKAIKTPISKAQKVQEEVEQMQQSIPVPISKAQLTDPITKVVREARAQGFSEEAIKLFLEGEGISASEIESAMAPETPASARVKISEKLSAGFDRMMGEVEGIIEKSKKRNVDQAKITENVLNYVMGSKVYENATDVQREKIIRDIKTKFGIRLKSAPSVARLLGTIKDVKKFTLTEKQLYIKRLKELQEGASTAVAAWKQASALMAQEIKTLVKSGTITARQGGFIVSKFAKVNMLSPKSVSRFVDYMGKVFADAEYGAQINTAKGLRGDIKKLSKNKDKNADFRKLAQEFINIDPAMVDDIYAYNEMASQIKSSVKGSTLRGEKVKFSEVVSIQDAARYISDTLRVQDKKILEEQRAEVQELMGIDASEMTPEQLRDLLEGEGKVTKYNESIVRSLLDKAFKAYSGVIDEILKTNYDAFYTGEKVELTKNQKTLIKQFMDMDLTVLTPKESLQAVDALANFIQNQSTAKMETIVSDYTGRLNARKLAESKVKAQPLMKYGLKGFGKFLAEQTTTLPILFEKMFKGFNRSGKVMDMMGVTKLINGKSLAQNQSNMIVNDYVRQFFNKKANGEAFNTESNNVERGMASFMMRNVIGTEQEMQSEFNRRRNLLKESIDVLSKGNDVEKQKAELYQKSYDKIVKDSKTIQEIKNKTDKTNLEAIDFWTNEWSNKYEELSDVSENVYNKILDKDINYTPDRFAKISSDTGEVELANDESAFHNNNRTIYKKETGVLMKAIKPETLPTNKKNGKPTSYIELSFDKNNSNSMYDALVDMKTASAIRQIEAFENSEDFEKIVPTADDAKILKDRVQLYVRNIRNKSPYSDDQFSKAVRRLNRLAAFGVGQALSGFGQPIKQMVPVLTNTLINAGSIDIMSGFNAAKQKFMSESGYGISNRGVESQAQIESLNKLIDKAPTGNFDKSIEWIEKVNRKYLEFFLVNPDVFIARASWMSYYEKSLKEQGVDPNGIDYNTHDLNEKAANYAQRMVDRQQNISDVDLSGKLFASKESSNQVLVKMLMPFASFRMNQSARLGADLATLSDKTATAEDKKIASKSLAGFGVELATFKIVSAGIAITLGTLTKALMGQDEDEEEKDKRINNVIKGQWTGTITDIISPLPVVDKPIQAAVETVSTLLEEGTGLPLSTFGVSKSDWTSNLGTFGISAQRATELYDMSMLAATGEYTDDFNKKKTISSERQSQITKLLPFAMLSNMGLAPSEVNTVVKNAVKYAKKNTKSPEEKQQAQENKEERESTKQEKVSALKTIIEESNDEAIINQAKDKIDELDADSEEKKIIKQENAEEKKEKKKLLVDPNTGEEYDTETDLKRYNRDLWEQNFGEGSDWYESHKEEKEMENLLRKKVQQMKDEEMNYTGRNSDGSKKRFGASGTKKTQRFGSSSKGKVKRFGS